MTHRAGWDSLLSEPGLFYRIWRNREKEKDKWAWVTCYVRDDSWTKPGQTEGPRGPSKPREDIIMDMSQIWSRAQACPGSPCDIHSVINLCHEERTSVKYLSESLKLATSSQLPSKRSHPRADIIFENSACLLFCLRAGLGLSTTIKLKKI